MNTPNLINVWEWEVEPCLWVPYEPKMCRFIENAFRQSQGSINLGSESPELACFQINFAMLKQLNLYTNESIRVRQQQYPSTYPLAKGILWMWWSDFRWALYDVPTMIHIEDEFQKNSQYLDLSLSPLAIPNIIDFVNMIQINKNTQKSRKIQRHKTSEQFPIAVYQLRQSSVTAGPSWMAGALQNPIHQRGIHVWNNGPYSNGASSNMTYTSAPSTQSANLLIHGPGIQNATLGPERQNYPPATSALHRAQKHPCDRSKEEEDSSSAHKKSKSGKCML